MRTQEGTKTIRSNKTVTNAEAERVSEKERFKKKFEQAKSTRDMFCPVRDIMARVSDKWTILTILTLGGFGTLRFSEIKNKITDVSQRMLTLTLRNLEEDGLVTRKVYAQVPPRVEYQLTDLGNGLLNQISLFAEWANAHSALIIKNRKKIN